MATIKEDYVSFETAKLLKEKGFPVPSNSFEDWVFCMYDENGDIQWGCYHPDWYARITLQMAMKWLREVHNIFIQVELYSKYNDYWFELFQNTYRLMVEKREVYNSYEEACEAAIKYCLEHLI